MLKFFFLGLQSACTPPQDWERIGVDSPPRAAGGGNLRFNRCLQPSLLISLVAAVSVVDAAPSKERFRGLTVDADRAQRSGRWSEALECWRQAHRIAPQATAPLYGSATSAARLQRVDEAFSWLDLTLDSGFIDVELLLVDGDLTSLRGDSRWPALVARARSAREDATRRALRLEPTATAAIIPSFKSYRQLATAFDRRAREFKDEEWRLSLTKQAELRKTLVDERVAAVARYLREHSKVDDAAEAAWDAVHQRISELGPYSLEYQWGPAGQAMVDELDRFINGFPASPHNGDARTYRAFAEFHIECVDTPENPRARAVALARLDAALGRVAIDFAGTTSGGLALVWRLVVANVASTDVVTPEMNRMRAELSARYSRDREVEALLEDVGRPALLRIDGFDHFEVTDLSGVKWSRDSLIGKVTLIEFWATWCRPCVLHLPVLRTAWATYRQGGFQIVGISLDEDSREDLKSWLTSNRVGWPQVWDGKGWETPLAKQLKVRGVPLSVLLDQKGNVAGVDLPDDVLLARIQTLLAATSAELDPATSEPLSPVPHDRPEFDD